MIRRSDFWLSFGLVATCGAVIGIGLAPTMSRTSQLKNEIAILEKDLSQPSSGPGMIADLEQKLGALKDFGEDRMTDVPEQSDIAGLMRDISETLERVGLQQHDITTRPPIELEYASSMPLALTLTGGFEQVYRAIRQIEDFDRLVRVDRIRIGKAERGRSTIDRTGVVHAEISVSAYYAPRELSEAGDEEGNEGE